VKILKNPKKWKSLKLKKLEKLKNHNKIFENPKTQKN